MRGARLGFETDPPCAWGQAPPEDALALGEAALAAGRPAGADAQIRLFEAVQDRLLRERYPAGLSSRLAEPMGPENAAHRGGDAGLGGDHMGAPDAGTAVEAGTAAEEPTDPARVPRPGAPDAGAGAAEPEDPDRVSQRPAGGPAAAGAAEGAVRPSETLGREAASRCAAPYDPALLHLARCAGGEVPDQALRAARTAAAAADWAAVAAVLARLPSLLPLVAALAWDDLGPDPGPDSGRHREPDLRPDLGPAMACELGSDPGQAAAGSPAADTAQAVGEGNNAQGRGSSRQGARQGAGQGVSTDGAADASASGPTSPAGASASSRSFRRRSELLAHLAGSGSGSVSESGSGSGSGSGLGYSSPSPAGPAAAALRRLHAQLVWRLDMARRVGAAPASIIAQGMPRTAEAAGARPARNPLAEAPSAPCAGSPLAVGAAGLQAAAGIQPRGAQELQQAGAGADTLDAKSYPAEGAAGSGRPGVSEGTGWEARAAAVLDALAEGSSPLSVLRSAARHLDEWGVLAAISSQPEAVRCR